ncbi:MAG: DNA sulfur modification protein DndB, partial [Microcystaceae cyanobacterium]
KNRPEVKGHVDEVKDYILSRVEQDKPWILGTLTANVNPERIDILELGRGICLVVIPKGIKLDITDGQHRKRAITELVSSEKGELIGRNNIPITLVLESDFRQCQRDFRDMAQTKALDKSLLHSFGEYEGCVGIMKNLVDSVPMFKDKTNKVTDRANPKKKYIYTVNYLTKLIGSAFANDPNAGLQGIDVEEATKTLSACLNQFFSECQQTKYIYDTATFDLSIETVQHFQENCVLGRSVGMEVLGRLLYSIYDSEIITFDSFKVSQLAQLDWSVNNELWHHNIVKVDPNPKNPDKPYGFTATMKSVRIAVEQVKQLLGWNNPY